MEGCDDSKEYKPDVNINYREELINKYKDYNFDFEKIDDSYIDLNDKKNLIKYCKDIIDKSYNQYPEPMHSILIKNLYYKTIKGMNKEEYLKEKAELENLDFIDKELKLLNNFPF
jgi:hypothetical protein